MIYEQATLIIPLSVATVLRKLSQMLDRNETDGMFTTGLSATGNAPATHFVSSGRVPAGFMRAIESPALLNTKAQAAFAKAGVTYPYTLAQITAALSGCSVSNGTRTVVVNSVSTVVSETPHEFIARRGLKMLVATI